MSAQSSELTDLLEALCENRMTPEEAARLEAVTLADPAALQTYLRYVELHGMLHWDAAAGARGTEHLRPVVTGTPVEAPDRRLHAKRLAAAAACLCLIAGWIALGRPLPFSGGNQTAGVTPPGTDASPDVESVKHPLPPVRLQPAPRDVAVADKTDQPVETPTDATAPPADPLAKLPPLEAVNLLLADHWRENEVTPSPVAADEEWVRRVHLDLIGRIPTADETERFLSGKRSDRRAKLVDDLLASSEFARHFGSVWTNLLIGHESPRRVNRPGLEKFLREQFYRNRPWSETIAKLISAEGFEDENGAANFLLAHVNNQAVPATAVVARVLMCEQLQCTQCHNHPTAEWTQDKFWQLNAFFQQTKVVRHRQNDPAGRKLPDRLELVNVEVGGPTFYEDRMARMKVAFPEYDGRKVDAGKATHRREELADLLSSGEEPQIARAMVNRMWAKLIGQGFTTPLDDMGPHNPAQAPELLDRLAKDFVASGFDLRQLLRWICLSDVYQRTSAIAAGNGTDDPSVGRPALFSRVYPKSMSAEQLFDSLLTATQADQAGAKAIDEAEVRRRAWLDQFYTALDNDENSEEDAFEGSLSQALVMMNGDLVRQGTTSASGGLLQRVRGAGGSVDDQIRRLSLATLSREPSPDELSRLRNLIRQQVQGRAAGTTPQTAREEALKDLLWAYLNSSEFRAIH